MLTLYLLPPCRLRACRFFEAQAQDPWREINICYVPDAGEGDITARLPWKVEGRWRDIGGVMSIG